MTGRYCFHRCLSVNISGGGYLVSDFRGGGLPGLRFSGGGYLVSDLGGGYLVSDFPGGGGGYLVLVKGKIFDSRFGLIHVQTGEKKFLLRDPPPPRNSKKIAMATRRAVCLLRSRRTTFLSFFYFWQISIVDMKLLFLSKLKWPTQKLKILAMLQCQNWKSTMFLMTYTFEIQSEICTYFIHHWRNKYPVLWLR